MRTLTITAIVAAVPALAAAQGAAPVKVNAVQFSSPTRVAELDMDKLKGQPARLAWSEDGSQIYVQTLEGTFGLPGGKLRHYIFNVQDGKKQDVAGEPEWASAYWVMKSGQTSPDVPSLRIEPKKDVQTQRTTSSPMGGDLARGGVDTGASGNSTGDAMAAAANKQSVAIVSLLLQGETIGEWQNAPMVPGQTFGWGPQGTKVIAFASPKGGKLVLMDDKGAKREVTDTKEASFPAWSVDGTQLAWLQKDGKKKFILQVARVSTSS